MMVVALEDSFNIDLAENGLEAYDQVLLKGRYYYHVIILDINMPIMDGCEACNRIHSFIHGTDLIKYMHIKGMRGLSSEQHVGCDQFDPFKESGDNILEPAKLYAFTSEVSSEQIDRILEKAPNFELIFDHLTHETRQLIIDNACTVQQLNQINRNVWQSD